MAPRASLWPGHHAGSLNLYGRRDRRLHSENRSRWQGRRRISRARTGLGTAFRSPPNRRRQRRLHLLGRGPWLAPRNSFFVFLGRSSPRPIPLVVLERTTILPHFHSPA